MELRPPQHLGEVAIEKGAFGSPSTEVVNFTLYIYIYIYTHEVYTISFQTSFVQAF